MTQTNTHTRTGPTDRLVHFATKWGFIAVTAALFIFFAVTEPSFRTLDNAVGMLKFIAPVGIAALGVTLAMSVGGLDLSVGATAGFAVSISAWTLVVAEQVGPVAVSVVVLSGALIGALNAALIVFARVPDLLATLATMFTVVGLKLIIVDGKSISSQMTLADGSTAPGVFTPDFLWFDRGSLGPIPVPVLLLIVLTTVVWWIMEHTRWGRALAAVGSNPRAAELAGIRVRAVRACAYIGCGILASIAGLVLAARIGQGDVSAGNSLLLDSVAVALVGVSVLGVGRPHAWGSLLGAALIAIMVSGFSMAGLPYYIQDFAKGVVLLVALLLSFTLRKKPITLTAGSTVAA